MLGLPDIPILGKALDKISDIVVEAGGRGLRYLFCYKSFVNDLDSKIEKLKDQEDRVSRKISQEKANGKTIENRVDKWQKEAQEIKARADKLIQHRHSRNPATRFRLGRKAAHEAKNVAEVTRAGEVLLNSEIAFQPDDPNIPISDTTYQEFDSREEAYGKLLEALGKEDGHPIIGIYGMPGVGKTTMMQKVWEEAKGKNIFDKVVRANVGAGTVDVLNLQSQLAGYLGCRLESIDNELLRASQLNRSLSHAGKTLVVLDDVWGPITLQNIGIPLGDDSKCKILLTSRKRDVCLRIGCKDPIQIEALTSGEAWDMFKKYVDTSKIDSALAEKVCKECGGLPLLIQTLGNTLEDATENSWKDALSQLQMGDLEDIDGIDSKVYTCIKLSFDKLPKAEKSCLLLCSVFPEDAEIEIKMLEDFATGSQLLTRGRNVKGLVDKLKSASLLLEGKTRQTVKLHDIIQDVARSVAARDEHYAFFFIRGDLRLPDIDDCSSRKLLQFLESDNFSYPIDMACPNVHTLWLECNKKPPQFSNSFFQGIGSLKILVLKDRHAFPEQIFVQSFHKLTYLILDGCALNKTWLSFVPENLETLRISKCHLPNPLDLSKLRCLRKLEVLCDSKIDIKMSTLPTTLAELHIPGGFGICDAEGKISSTPISSELNKLNGLKSLNIWLEDSKSCPNENIVDDLLDFIIEVGDKIDKSEIWWIRNRGVWNLEKSVEIKSRCIEGGVKVLVERAEEVMLENVKGSWNGFSTNRRDAFSTLKRLVIRGCSEMEHVVAYTPQNEIHQSQPLTPFSNLTILYIYNCDELKYLFSAAVAKCLLQLQELDIGNCRRLEEVVIRKEKVIDDDGTIIYFPKLKQLWLEYLPNLRRFYGEKRSSATLTEDLATTGSDSLFDGTVVFSSLEALRIVGINTSEIWGNNCWNHNSFGELKSLSIRRCPNLKFGISTAMLPTFQNLGRLDIWKCKSMRSEVEISRSESESESESSNPPTLVALRWMRLWDLPALTQTGLNSKRRNLLYPILQTLDIWSCSSLRNVLLPSIAKHLQKCLQELLVMNCEMMSEIIGGGEEEKEGERLNQFVFPHLRELYFSSLPNFKSLCFSDSKTLIQNTAPTTVPLFQQMVVLPSIQTLYIEDMNISEIWEKNCCNDNSFRQLKYLEIRKCHNLEFAIPLAMWPTFQNLEKLKIEDCNSVVSEVESGSSSPELTPYVALCSIKLFNLPTQTRLNTCSRNLYPNLETLEITNCDCLKNVFLPSTVKHLVLLRELKVTNCELMIEIIGEEEKEGETSYNEFVFPELTHLELDTLPNFKRFCFNDSKTLIQNAAPTTVPLFHQMVVLPSIQDLCIGGMNISEIWGENCCNGNSFCQLKSLTIRECPNLEFAIPLVTWPKFQNLEKLEIEDCSSMASEVESSSSPELTPYVALRSIKLFDLPALTQTRLNTCSINLYPNLETLHIRNCNSLKNVFLPSTVKHLVLLRKLKVTNCELMIQIIGEEEKEGETSYNEFVFPELTHLELDTLPNFKRFCFNESVEALQHQSYMASKVSFPKLVIIKFNLKTVKFEEMDVGTASEIKVMLVNCDNQVQLPSKWKLKFPNTIELTIKNCWWHANFCISNNKCIEGAGESLVDRTEEVMLEDVNREAFSNMTKLSIESCKGMEHVACIPYNQIQQSRPITSFSKLTELRIISCSGLKYLFSACVAKCLVELQQIHIQNCQALEVVIRKESDIPGVIIKFPKLKQLLLSDLQSLGSFCGENRGTSSSITTMMENNDASTAGSESLFDGMVTFPALEQLQIQSLRTSEIWEENYYSNDSFCQLKFLDIRNCHNLEFAIPLAMSGMFQNLEKVKIRECESMSSEVDSRSSDECRNQELPLVALRSILLYKMPVLTHTRLNSRGRNLYPNLEKLSIKECNNLRNVFLPSIAKDLIVRLKKLTVESCEMMSEIIGGEEREGLRINEFVFPALTTLQLTRLPNFKSFCFDESVEERQHQYYLAPKVSFPNIEIFKFNVNGAPNCFSNSNIDAFPNLKKLFIRSREGIETLACRPQYEIQQSQQPFSELSKLFIHKCSGLKYLFCASVVKCLVQLRHLWIIDCPALEAIIRNESANDDVIISFPNLQQLRLYFLPSLRSFYRENRGTSPSSSTTMENASISSVASESLFDEMVAFPSLELLSMKALERSEIWGKNCCKTKHFSCLKSLEILHCHNLEFAIPLAMLPTFQNLEELKISKCDSMSEIIRKEANQVRNYELVFPELTKLQLKNLPNFKSFCFNEFVEAQAASLLHQFHLVTKVSLPKLLELEVYVKAITLDEIELSQSDSAFELKKLKVRCGNKVQLPYRWQLKLPNVEELCLESCWWHGSSGEHNVEQFLINPYGTPSFQNLEAVEVRSCGLSVLFSCSVFLNLRQLKKLKVKNCPLLEEVVREEDNVVGTSANTISLLNLESIEFKNLPKLKSFSRSSSYAFNLPALELIVLRNCPQMEKFTCLEISTQSMPDFNSRIEKYLSNPNEGDEVDSSDADSDEDSFNIESFMEERFDAYY